jgi:hypothetical protein
VEPCSGHIDHEFESSSFCGRLGPDCLGTLDQNELKVCVSLSIFSQNGMSSGARACKKIQDQITWGLGEPPNDSLGHTQWLGMIKGNPEFGQPPVIRASIPKDRRDSFGAHFIEEIFSSGLGALIDTKYDAIFRQQLRHGWRWVAPPPRGHGARFAGEGVLQWLKIGIGSTPLVGPSHADGLEDPSSFIDAAVCALPGSKAGLSLEPVTKCFVHIAECLCSSMGLECGFWKSISTRGFCQVGR